MCCQGTEGDLANLMPEHLMKLQEDIVGYLTQPTAGGGAPRYTQPATRLPRDFPLTSPVDPMSMMGADIMTKYLGGEGYQPSPYGTYDWGNQYEEPYIPDGDDTEIPGDPTDPLDPFDPIDPTDPLDPFGPTGDPTNPLDPFGPAAPPSAPPTMPGVPPTTPTQPGVPPTDPTMPTMPPVTGDVFGVGLNWDDPSLGPLQQSLLEQQQRYQAALQQQRLQGMDTVSDPSVYREQAFQQAGFTPQQSFNLMPGQTYQGRNWAPVVGTGPGTPETRMPWGEALRDYMPYLQWKGLLPFGQ